MGSLAYAANAGNWDQTVRYLERVPPEYSVFCVRDAIRRNGICPLHRRSFASVAYSQLDLAVLGGDAEVISFSERGADVIDIREAILAESDPDDVEPIARDA